MKKVIGIIIAGIVMTLVATGCGEKRPQNKGFEHEFIETIEVENIEVENVIR